MMADTDFALQDLRDHGRKSVSDLALAQATRDRDGEPPFYVDHSRIDSMALIMQMCEAEGLVIWVNPPDGGHAAEYQITTLGIDYLGQATA